VTAAGTSCSHTDTQTVGLARRMHGRTGGVTLGDDFEGLSAFGLLLAVTSSLLCGKAGGRPELMDPGQVKARQGLEDMTGITDRHI
jgi:hypothetical protein